METSIMGFIGASSRIHSFIPSYSKVRLSNDAEGHRCRLSGLGILVASQVGEQYRPLKDYNPSWGGHPKNPSLWETLIWVLAFFGGYPKP